MKKKKKDQKRKKVNADLWEQVKLGVIVNRERDMALFRDLMDGDW